MPVARAAFLYPHLVRAAARPFATAVTSRTAAAAATASPQTRRELGLPRWKSTFAPRHGKGVEPTAFEKAQQQQDEGEIDGSVAEVADTEKDAKGQAEPTTEGDGTENLEQTAPSTIQDERSEQKAAESSSQTAAVAEEGKEAAAGPPNEDHEGTSTPSPEPASNPATPENPIPEAATPGGPLEAIMHMPAPDEKDGNPAPSMSPPRYVHHFDSYTLVRQLKDGGYTQDQAITFMKGIRMLLAEHLDVAQESLVSKSDVENETYLFSAACSELSTELKNNRRLSDEQLRQQRTHLQHELDNLTQHLNHELLTLKDTVKELFNDRKMVASEEQRAVDSAIQQINYRMSIMLSSDSKSEIEGVRWILIQRSVLGIIFMAMVTLATLRYASYLSQERKKEAEREKQREEDLKRDGGKNDHASASEAGVLLVEGG